MQIDILPTEQQKLEQLAQEAGYSDVQVYVTDHIKALANQPSAAEFLPLSQGDLEASLAMIDSSMAEFEAGGGLSIAEARRRSLQQLRSIDQ